MGGRLIHKVDLYTSKYGMFTTDFTCGSSFNIKLLLCGSRKYPYPPHGGSRKFQGVEGCERGKSPKGKGVCKELFFPEGWKCDRIKHL